MKVKRPYGRKCTHAAIPVLRRIPTTESKQNNKVSGTEWVFLYYNSSFNKHNCGALPELEGLSPGPEALLAQQGHLFLLAGRIGHLSRRVTFSLVTQLLIVLILGPWTNSTDPQVCMRVLRTFIRVLQPHIFIANASIRGGKTPCDGEAGGWGWMDCMQGQKDLKAGFKYLQIQNNKRCADSRFILF